MTPAELRAIMDFLGERVRLRSGEKERPVVVAFAAPTGEEMIAAGLNPEGVRRIMSVEWWDEMVEDIVGTPDFCEPDDSPEQVLAYARDVVSEYIRKRFPLEDG
jgi:hypothetical protein